MSLLQNEVNNDALTSLTALVEDTVCRQTPGGGVDTGSLSLVSSDSMEGN